MHTELDTLEARRQELQARFDASRSQPDRNRLGQFATPQRLALDIARYLRTLWPRAEAAIRFCDPAVGSGAFYSAFRSVFHADRVDSALGIEIDPELAKIARDLWGSQGLHVVQGDFTRLVATPDPPQSPNLIFANPPYVRHHHLGRNDKTALQRLTLHSTGVAVNGLAGLYVYFVLLASQWMEEGGLAVWLIPSEFMDVNYGEALRRYLTERVTLLRLHRFDPREVQFDDALVSSAVVVIRKAVPTDSDMIRFTLGGTIEEPATWQEVPIRDLRRVAKWTRFPSPGQLVVPEEAGERGREFSDFFRVQRGIATGCDKVFILPREQARNLGLPDQCLRPILPSPRHLHSTILEPDDEGYPKIENPLALIDCRFPEPIVREQFPALWEYLQEAEKEGIRSRYLLRTREPWYAVEQRRPAPFLCTYMGRGTDEKRPFRFIWNKTPATATNLFLVIYPRGQLGDLLRVRPQLAASVFEFLGGISADDLRGAGRVYGGGLHKMEPSELGHVPAVTLVERLPELLDGKQQLALFG